MKKRAFTLMEILLALGIIGIIAMIMARVISGVMPDREKAAFLRAYLTTKTIVATMINDTSIYPAERDIDGYAQHPGDGTGFANTSQPTYGLYASSTYSGSNKFKNIFLDMLGDTTRDGVTYEVTGQTIKITSNTKDESGNLPVLGTFVVDNDGGVSCSSSRSGYCDDMTDLKKKYD